MIALKSLTPRDPHTGELLCTRCGRAGRRLKYIFSHQEARTHFSALFCRECHRAKSTVITDSANEKKLDARDISSRTQYAEERCRTVTGRGAIPAHSKCAEQDTANGPDRQALAIGVKGAHTGLERTVAIVLHLRDNALDWRAEKQSHAGQSGVGDKRCPERKNSWPPIALVEAL